MEVRRVHFMVITRLKLRLGHLRPPLKMVLSRWKKIGLKLSFNHQALIHSKQDFFTTIFGYPDVSFDFFC